MSLYSLKMRASRHAGNQTLHISGAEKIIPEEQLGTDAAALLQRALHHAKGSPDFINIKAESVSPADIQHIDALPVSSINTDTAGAGQKEILALLEKLGIKNGMKIMEKFRDTHCMRGAMLLDADTLERLEPDQLRGIRATYMDAEPSVCSSGKNHYKEAVVLASKVANAPHIIAEICISDDPDYVTGYVAAKKIGYVRITKLKKQGCPDGGRIFLYRGKKESVSECIDYLENQKVLVRNVPLPDETASSDRHCLWSKIHTELDRLHQQHLYRDMHEIASPQSEHIICDDRSLLLLASNNYLGLTDDPRVKSAAIKAIEQFGTGSGGSRLTTGTNSLHLQLEKELSLFKNTDSTLLYNTGYMANTGILSALCNENTIIFSDELNHASIIDGCRLSRGKTVIYRHSDMRDLEQKIKENFPCRGIIVSDAVFSMDGDIADLPQILHLAKRYQFLSMLDEAHSTGVIGKTGRGIAEYYGSAQQPDILMGTMSKALAGEGGFVCGRRPLIDYLCNKSRSFIFSTSLSPAVAASALKALEIIEKEPFIVKKLQDNTSYFCYCLRQNGIPADSPTAIVPIKAGSEERAAAAAQTLLKKGIYLSAIRYPTVRLGQARLRAAIMATHRRKDLAAAANCIADTISRHHK